MLLRIVHGKDSLLWAPLSGKIPCPPLPVVLLRGEGCVGLRRQTDLQLEAPSLDLVFVGALRWLLGRHQPLPKVHASAPLSPPPRPRARARTPSRSLGGPLQELTHIHSHSGLVWGMGRGWRCRGGGESSFPATPVGEAVNQGWRVEGGGRNWVARFHPLENWHGRFFNASPGPSPLP